MQPPAEAAQPANNPKPEKERLVLMPLHVPEEDKSLHGSMETALVEGLQQKYEVFSGDKVAQKARAIFQKESRANNKNECDETRCMQDIAIAFQTELIATASVTKRTDGYLLTLSIHNIFDNKVMHSRSLSCKNCDIYQVLDKLKEISGTATATPQASNDPNVNNDPEAILWNEVQKGNSAVDFGVYLSTYPNGKFVSLAKAGLAKLSNGAAEELARKEQGVWDLANYNGNLSGYEDYLSKYPKGQYAELASARLNKLKKEAEQVAEQTKTTGKPFKDCADCPEMVVIPAGSFDMGETGSTHRVTLRTFALGKTEVTQAQWKSIMGKSPPELRFPGCGDNCPVERVSWQDAQEYIAKLSDKAGKQYRLPSESEWEYACRAGSRQAYCGSNNPDDVAWYGAEYKKAEHWGEKIDVIVNPQSNTTVEWRAPRPPSGKRPESPSPVATKMPNAFGLFDMSGNVWEWVTDSYFESFTGAPSDGSAWQGTTLKRVIRGGAWVSRRDEARADTRSWEKPETRRSVYGLLIGFRVARELP